MAMNVTFQFVDGSFGGEGDFWSDAVGGRSVSLSLGINENTAVGIVWQPGKVTCLKDCNRAMRWPRISVKCSATVFSILQ